MPRAKAETPPLCLRCELPISGGGGVRLSNGWMHGDCHKQQSHLVHVDLADAIAAGTHGPVKVLCQGVCGRWVDGYYHSCPYSKKDVCADCADTMFNAGPIAWRKRNEGRSEKARAS